MEPCLIILRIAIFCKLLFDSMYVCCRFFTAIISAKWKSCLLRLRPVQGLDIAAFAAAIVWVCSAVSKVVSSLSEQLVRWLQYGTVQEYNKPPFKTNQSCQRLLNQEKEYQFGGPTRPVRVIAMDWKPIVMMFVGKNCSCNTSSSQLSHWLT